jgi:outer membrane protein assembly factor BamB
MPEEPLRRAARTAASSRPPSLLRLIVLTVLAVAGPIAGPIAGFAEDDVWPSWRGPEHTGQAEGNPPLTWSETENVRWKVDVPGLGTSTPTVWGSRIFLTTAIDTGKAGDLPAPQAEAPQGGRPPRGAAPSNVLQFTLMAFDLDTGALVWERAAREQQPHEGHHPDGTFASNSAVVDAERVYVSFGSQGIYAFTHEGEKVWEVDLGDMTTRLGFGEGSSPALADGKLVVLWDHEGESFVVALDAATGEEKWRVARDEMTSWTSPLIVEHDGQKQVVTAATGKVRSYELATGELLWEAPGMTLNAIPSPVTADGVVYLMSGFRGNTALAIDLDRAKGDVTGTDAILWTLDRDTPYVPSPLLYDGILYFLKSNNGLLTAVEASSGRVIYGPERLDAVRNIYASPVGAAGRVYLLGRDGGAVVLEHGRALKVLAENNLDDAFDASPVVAGNRLLLRGRQRLYCLEAGG